ncbi:MAG: ATP-binding cassette domain-containing protein [Candidatus Caenarcaniphilales bacterium]|nr:ATP-binding cassette domain-containing protein [Candidatus Caenarcaniphilales bacterium]
MALLELKNLNKKFDISANSFFAKEEDKLHVVNDLSLSLEEAECLVLVGESGCGKSTLAKLVTRILDCDSGEIQFLGEDFLALKSSKLREKRKAMQMIFQNPFSSLDPRFKIFDSIAEPLRINKAQEGFPKNEAEIKDKVYELMSLVELDPVLATKFPHQCSGGQNQRVCIARAIASKPKLIIADEAVSALDVSVQWVVLKLMKKLKEELGISFLFITHDLAVVKFIADRVAVMYLGEIVEMASKDDLFKNPKHPYTRALLNAAPIPDPKIRDRERFFLEGEIPKANKIPAGCAFHTRCPERFEACSQEKPILKDLGDEAKVHCVSCLLYK